MRIIGGSAGGRRLAGPPPGAATRPTSDKVRGAIFNVVGERVRDARVLDLFAGTGAMGIEALSRGAASATFVEADRVLCDTIRRNLATVGLAGNARVLCRDVRRALESTFPEGTFDLVVIDPPYGLGLEALALEALADGNALADGAWIVVEHAARETVRLGDAASHRLEVVRTKHYGDTAVTCYVPRETQSSAHPVSQQEAKASAMTRIAIYPGSFDPMTKGHHDVMTRSLAMFDRLVIAVAGNVRKQPLFSADERIAMIREVLGDDERVEVETFDGLLVEYATRKGAVAVVRGLRAVADFEFEFEMASMNRRLAPTVETVFLMTHESYFYVSSHLVKEVATLGGDIEAFVPAPVAARLKERLRELARPRRAT